MAWEIDQNSPHVFNLRPLQPLTRPLAWKLMDTPIEARDEDGGIVVDASQDVSQPSLPL